MSVRFFSYGGGVQSTAALVLAATGRIDFPDFVMANVGDDSEHPDTLAYVHDVAMPFAAAHSIGLHLVDRRRRDGSIETLWGRLMRPGSRSLPIPVRMSNGAPGTRSCTADFKIRVTGKWAKQHGATAADPAIVGIGISLDEIHRANNLRTNPYEQIDYPLLELRLRRSDCARIISNAGLPVPPKSSCFFCPFQRSAAWQDLARDTPELFDRSCQLEDTLNERRVTLGKDPVFLTRFGIPLRRAIGTDQDLLPFDVDTDGQFGSDGQCDSGWCGL